FLRRRLPRSTLFPYTTLFRSSLKIAAIVTVLSVVIGFLAALGLNRGQFLGRDVLRALFLTPMILPVVVLAVALYALFLKLGLARSEEHTSELQSRENLVCRLL